MSRPLRIAVLGGGNGIASVLRGLVRVAEDTPALELTAIVSIADDGGSSGRIRRERGGAALGDLRNALCALASRSAPAVAGLLQHRFSKGGSLEGHALGNLVLAGLVDRDGCLQRAIDAARDMFGIRHRVLPVSLDEVHLAGVTSDGTAVSGEANIGEVACAMRDVWLEPADPRPAPGTLDAIRGADLVVVGPGSLFTSILPVLLTPGVADAVREADRSAMVANLMSQPGETLGMGFRDHLETLDRHVDPRLVDDVVVHSGRAPCGTRLARYEVVGAEYLAPPSAWDRPERISGSDLATNEGKIRHDPDRLADALVRLATTVSTRVEGNVRLFRTTS